MVSLRSFEHFEVALFLWNFFLPLHLRLIKLLWLWLWLLLLLLTSIFIETCQETTCAKRKTNCAITTSFSQPVLLSAMALDQSAREIPFYGFGKIYIFLLFCLLTGHSQSIWSFPCCNHNNSQDSSSCQVAWIVSKNLHFKYDFNVTVLLWKLWLINLQPLVLILSCFRAGLIFYRVGVKGINKKTGKDILLDYIIEEVSGRSLNCLILVWITLCLWGRLSLKFTPCRGIQVPESGVWNPGKFCLWNLNPGLWNPEYGSRNLECH